MPNYTNKAAADWSSSWRDVHICVSVWVTALFDGYAGWWGNTGQCNRDDAAQCPLSLTHKPTHTHTGTTRLILLSLSPSCGAQQVLCPCCGCWPHFHCSFPALGDTFLQLLCDSCVHPKKMPHHIFFCLREYTTKTLSFEYQTFTSL